MLLMTFPWVVYDVLLYIEPITNVANHFGWLGDQNGVFGWERVLGIVVFELPDEASLKRSYPSLKRAAFVVAQNCFALVCSSELQANSKRAKPNVSSFRSLKRDTRRLSEQREFLPKILKISRSLKRTVSELQASKTQTFVIWLAQASRASLKWAGSCATILWILLRALGL